MPDYNRYTSLLDLSVMVDFVMQHGKLRLYKKGEYFIRQGQKSRLVGFVWKGAFCYGCTHTDGNSSMVGYAFDNGFVGDYPALQNLTSSTVDIQALCDSEVYVVTYDQLNDFYNHTSGNQLLGRRIAEVLLLEVYDRMISMYSQTPEERYLDILQRIPGLLTMISLKELASYLMITPETLSRIRKKLVKK